MQQLDYNFDPTLTDTQGRWKAPVLAAGGPYQVWVKLYREGASVGEINGVTVRGGETVAVGKVTVPAGARVPGPAPPEAGAAGPPPGD